MKIRVFFLSLVTLFTAAFFTACSGDEQRSSSEEFDPDEIDYAGIIEDATFTDLDGNDVSLADFRGKVLVIDFWETWCGPCLQVFPSLEELRQEYPDDFEVLAVTLGMSEGPEEARAFREEHDYNFHFLYDEYNISDELGIYSIPFKMYIDPEGRLIRHEIGSKGREGDYENAKTVIDEYRSE